MVEAQTSEEEKQALTIKLEGNTDNPCVNISDEDKFAGISMDACAKIP